MIRIQPVDRFLAAFLRLGESFSEPVQFRICVFVHVEGKGAVHIEQLGKFPVSLLFLDVLALGTERRCLANLLHALLRR